MKNGKRWLSLPSREFQDKDTGEKKYMSIMRFMEKAHNDAFCKAALKALDDFCAQHAHEEPAQEQSAEGLPF